MDSSRFLEFLDASPLPLLGDGAMGTMLNRAGASFEGCFDALNIHQPDLVRGIHRTYLEAGARLIETNTFGANRYKLAAHGLADRVSAINRAGVELAHQAAWGAEDVFVAGDVGPLGVRLAPFGRVQVEDGRRAFGEQIQALADAGVDLILLETFSDLNELCEALAAARSVCGLPVVASLTFTRDDRTLLGDSPAAAARRLAELGADLIGVNCSGGPAQILRVLRQMAAAIPGSRFSAMPNAGWPEQVGGRIMYPAHPEYFSDYASAFCEVGARLIGGCCGTTPEHIAALRRALDQIPGGCSPSAAELALPEEREEPLEAALPTSQLARKLAEGRFVLAVEMDPPRGLSTHKLLAGASLLADSGADVINVADSPMARMRMSAWAVCDLVQRQVGVETTLHFPTRGRNLLRVQGDLLAAHALGIRNVFVVMGDPTAIGDYPEAMDNYDLTPSGLIGLVKRNFNLGLDHAGVDIGQPTSFFVGCALNLCPLDAEREIKNLRRKLQAGADFILTQPVFDPPSAESLLRRYADTYGPLETPILAGVMPLFSERHATFLHNEVPGVSIPPETRERIRAAGGDAPWEGVRIAVELVDQMRGWASGVYIMPQFGRYDLTAEIVDRSRSKPGL